MNQDTIVAIGWILWVLSVGFIWVLQAFLRNETMEYSTSEGSLLCKDSVRLVNMATSYLIIRVMRTVGAVISTVVVGGILATPIQKWVHSIFPSSLLAVYCLLAIVCLVRLTILLGDHVKLNLGAILTRR